MLAKRKSPSSLAGKILSMAQSMLTGFPLWIRKGSKDLWSLRQSTNVLDCFRIPMSREAYNQFLDLQQTLMALPPVEHDRKMFGIIWGQQQYS
jgi:hypothetical protein